MTDHGADNPDRGGRDGGYPPWLGDLCVMAAKRSGIASVTIVVSGRKNAEGAVAHSDVVASDAHALEFTLGEGPTTDVLSVAIPMLACDLATMTDHWPQFAPAALRLDVESISAVPLRVGAARLGALTFYAHARCEPRDLSVVNAFGIADAVVSGLLNYADEVKPGARVSTAEATLYRAVVHQATGMVAVQLGCEITDALLRLRALAYARSESVEHVARAVVNRQIRVEA